MAEPGCLKDGHFHNLEVEGHVIFHGTQVGGGESAQIGAEVVGDLEVTGTFQQGRNKIPLTADTLLLPTVHGVTIAGGTYVSVTGDDKTISLPAPIPGVVFIIVNDNPDGTGLLSINPFVIHRFLINIAGAPGVVNKDIHNTKATQKKGDFVKLVASSSADSSGWIIDSIKGTWTDEA